MIKLECWGRTDAGEFTARLRLENGRAAWSTHEAKLLECDTDTYFALSSKLIGRSPREWSTTAQDFGLPLAVEAVIALTGREQNLLRASFLIALWLEPLLRRSQVELASEQLHDQLIIDNTGRPGIQPYLYFPGALPEEVARALYDSALLAKLCLTSLEQAVTEYFKPLVTPIIRTDSLPRPAREHWDFLKNKMRERSRQLVGAPR